MTRRLALVGINIVVFCVLAELVGLGIYYFEHGWLFYSHDRQPYAVVSDAEKERLVAEGIHPYLGFTHRPGTPFEIPADLQDPDAGPVRRQTNNFGFVSDRDYPVRRTGPRQFIVGIFGGSVGVWFCQVGAGRLIASLEQHVFFKDREIVPLCFSHEGYKQPQQLLALTYFLSAGQQFDLVLNIDGFNEVALSGLNDQRGLDISMPSVQHLEPLINLVDQATMTPAKVRTLAGILDDKERLNALALRLNSTRLAIVHAVLERYYGMVEARYRNAVIAFDKLPAVRSSNSAIQVTAGAHREGAALFDDIAAMWTRSSMLMSEMLAARAVPYVHVLQPNQYYTTRQFSGAEERVAVNQESPYRENVGKGYPVLVEAASRASMAKAGFVSGIHAFDDEPRPVYYDNCCHYTRVGYQRLAEFAAASILRSPGPWNSR